MTLAQTIRRALVRNLTFAVIALVVPTIYLSVNSTLPTDRPVDATVMHRNLGGWK